MWYTAGGFEYSDTEINIYLPSVFVRLKHKVDIRRSHT